MFIQNIVLLTYSLIGWFVPTSQGPRSFARADLGYARYHGTRLSNGVNQFLGMRYAAPPVGELRWRAPRSPETQSDTQIADQVQNVIIFFS
jgi:acetylcholinesterase